MKRRSLLHQTAVLSCANGLVRALGFVMRIWLSRVMGAEAIGVLELASSAHMLWIAPATSGIPLAVAREAAAGQGEAALRAGRRLVRRIALWMMPFLVLLLPVIARLLGDMRTLPALLVYLPCLPMLGLSAAYNGYCYGMGDTLPPALSELLEQALRFAVCAAVLLSVSDLTAAGAAAVPPLATLIGEIAGLALVVRLLGRHGLSAGSGARDAALEKKIWSLAAPVTGMRVTNTLMRTVNAAMLPLRLRAGGLSAQEATARLGMFSGMAMPWVMLPGVVTGALAMVVGPALARRERDGKALRRLLLRVLPGALGISLLCGAGLWVASPFLAMHVYRQPDLAALLPALAPLVPVTGLEQVLGGMLAGLGKQRSTLAASLTGALLTLALNYALVPEHALTGCAWAHIAGHSLTLLMNLRTLIRTARRV